MTTPQPNPQNLGLDDDGSSPSVRYTSSDGRSRCAHQRQFQPSEAAACRFCFVHIDVGLYQPTRDSLEFFYPRTSPGGMIVCDHYGYVNCPGTKQACDELAADWPERWLHLPTDQGLLTKQTAAATCGGQQPEAIVSENRVRHVAAAHSPSKLGGERLRVGVPG